MYSAAHTIYASESCKLWLGCEHNMLNSFKGLNNKRYNMKKKHQQNYGKKKRLYNAEIDCLLKFDQLALDFIIKCMHMWGTNGLSGSPFKRRPVYRHLY